MRKVNQPLTWGLRWRGLMCKLGVLPIPGVVTDHKQQWLVTTPTTGVKSETQTFVFYPGTGQKAKVLKDLAADTFAYNLSYMPMLKRRHYILTIYILTFSWLTSCKIPLTENQLKIIDCVNKGDTLIFQADNGNRDTMVISDKGTYLQELNPIFGNTWYRPENAFIKFYNTNRDKGQFYDLVHIYGGRTPSQPDCVTIDIRTYYCFLSKTNDSLGEQKSDPIEINGKVYSDYFIRTDHCSDCPVDKDSCDIEKLYWSLEKGPLMYIDIRKQKWTRVK